MYSFNCREGHSIVTGAAHFIHRRFYEMYAADSDISNQRASCALDETLLLCIPLATNPTFFARAILIVVSADSLLIRSCSHCAVRAFVTGGGCCDDIAMNALVSYTTGKGPVWVKAPYSTIKTSTAGGWAGKSAQSGWMLKRGGAVGSTFHWPLPCALTSVTSLL